MRQLWGALLLTVAALACGSDDEATGSSTSSSSTGGSGGMGGVGASGGSGGSGGEGGAGTGGGGGEGPWDACSLFTGDNGGGAECATFPLPARRSDASLGDIDVFVKRILTNAPRRGTLWLLQGGPGGSGVAWEGLVSTLQLVAPGFDIYIPDHRGVGRSSRLSCPVEEGVGSEDGPLITDGELPSCIDHLQAEWGDRLPGFSGVEAAADLGDLIDLIDQPGDEHFLFGVSYGTQWAHRFLHLHPNKAAGVVIDSICAPQCLFSEIDQWFDQLAQSYFGLCGADAACSARVTSDPYAFASSVFSDLANGSCAARDPRLTPLVIKDIFAQTLYNYTQRKLIAPILYRLDRCNSADVNALDHVAEVLFAPFTEPLPPQVALDSGLLGLNVGLVDNFPDAPPPLASLEAALDGYNAALGASVSFRQAFDLWPLYPKDAYFDQLATSATPVLMLQGDLDFIPLSAVQPVIDHFSGPGQHAAVMPGAPHGAIFQSPLPVGDCAAQVLADFVADTGNVDTSCTSAVLPLEFEPEVNEATFFLGTPDAWDGDPGPVNAQAQADVQAQRLANPELVELVWRVRNRAVR